MILKGWYSQDGWRTKLTLINQNNEYVMLRMKLFEGENGKLLATLNLRLKPKEMRFYDLGRIKRIEGKAGLILIEPEKPLVCTAQITNQEDEMKVLYYRLPSVEEKRGCC
jgi:hypothetical protein